MYLLLEMVFEATQLNVERRLHPRYLAEQLFLYFSSYEFL